MKSGKISAKKIRRGKTGQCLLLLSVVIFTICSIRLGAVCLKYRAAEHEYREIAAIAVPDDVPEIAPVAIPESGARIPEINGVLAPAIDFKKLSALNSDLVGWIEIPALEISYPVVQAHDNDTYLNQTFNGGDNSAGCIFMDFRNASELTDRNTILYGHNMKNGAMFGKLKNYREKETAEMGAVFFYSTPVTAFLCEVISCRTVSASDEEYPIQFNDNEEFMEYTEKIRRESLQTFETAVSEDDRLITLSTCCGKDAVRFVVQARVSAQNTSCQTTGVHQTAAPY